MVQLPVGHTTSCIEELQVRVDRRARAAQRPARTSGRSRPAARGDGRPIWVTNLKDPAHPEVYPKPIDLGRNDGMTDYSHDVDVDGKGVAWISGRGGLTGYATRGRGAIRRPTGFVRQAVGSGAGRRRRHPRRQQRRRAAADGLHPQLDAADRRRGASARAWTTTTSC